MTYTQWYDLQRDWILPYRRGSMTDTQCTLVLWLARHRGVGRLIKAEYDDRGLYTETSSKLEKFIDDELLPALERYYPDAYAQYMGYEERVEARYERRKEKDAKTTLKRHRKELDQLFKGLF